MKLARRFRNVLNGDRIEMGYNRPCVPCDECGTKTTTRAMMIDPVSLRRTFVPRCASCRWDYPEDPVQKELRSKRYQIDRGLLTDPLDMSSIDTHLFPEQYSSRVRRVLRAFLASEAEAGVVNEDIGASSLNQTIATLGLRDELYAEERSGQTVLRRIRCP